MEVHHHPEVHHKKKKFNEYFLEFIMIFLAVTLGFFAENLREKIADSHREKEFAQQLYAELKDDSIVAANILVKRFDKEKDMDFLRSYFKDSSLIDLPKKFYPAFTTSLYLINSYAFEPKDGILSQLRNSGSIHYFRSVALQKLIGDLSVSINNMRYRNEQEYQFFASPIKAFMLQHFDFNWLDQIRNADKDPTMINVVKHYFQSNAFIKANILNVSSLDRNETCNMIVFYKQMLISTQSLHFTNYINTNKKILQVLRENYSLENE